jgi:hypothetical protein
MILSRCLPSLVWSAPRPSAASAQLWSTLRCLTRAQLLALRGDVPPLRPSRPITGCRTPGDLVLRLALVAFVFSILALWLPAAAGSLYGEARGPLRVVALESRVSPALSRSAEHPLRTAGRLTLPLDASFTLDDDDQDDDDASDMLLLSLKAHALPPDIICIRFNAVTHACVWPTDYLVRPQLLSRL